MYKADWPVEALFDSLPDIVFFVKDLGGKYVVANTTLAVRCSLRDKQALIGKTPSEVLGASLGASYEKQDRAVLETGDPILNQLELHIYPNRSIGWCLTNKHAVRDDRNLITGLAGVSQDLRAPDRNHDDYAQLKTITDYVDKHLGDPPDIKKLSAIVRLSPYQLDRRFRRVFGLSTGQWVLKQRLDLARRQLLQSQAPIAEIALNAGYRDQSAFSRQFMRATGLTPSAFRKARSND